jgi:2-polyprenyl-6-hydroxyphenyl methylase/3-demethylubiquinone-9 3-methyltransferase
MSNVDRAEIGKFDALAHRWWDPEGDFRTLHDINPTRLAWISKRSELLVGEVLDVGCGGGILAESMARTGATVTGIDLATNPLRVARLHALAENVALTYLECAAEQLLDEPANRGRFRTVTCLEMLEHVPDYGSVIAACAELTAAGGDLFFSTINRNPIAYLTIVLGAEYVLDLLPRGTHDYARFIRPSELAAAVRAAGLDVREITGMSYNPFTRTCRIGAAPDVNYLLHARKPRLP